MERIVLCEPQCRGFEHASPNAAMLATVLLAYPQARASFGCEPDHGARVRDELARRHADLLQRVDWFDVTLPTKRPSRWGRLAEERVWWEQVLARCRADNPGLVFLCSITSPGLMVVKSSLRRGVLTVPVVAVVHSILSTLGRWRPAGPVKWLLGLRNALRLPHPGNLRLIALGAPIHQRLREVAPAAARHFAVLDLPALWALDAPTPRDCAAPVTFGHLGVAAKRKGFAAFCDLARACAAEVAAGRARFEMVGFTFDQAALSMAAAAPIAGVSDCPLSAEEYRLRTSVFDYVIWTGDTRKYALTASATFQDALSYIKPVVGLRSPYIAHYAERIGDVGYLCDDYAGMLETVRSLAAEFPAERYQQQCENILRGRDIFAPETLAPRLREIVAGIETD